MKRGKKLIALLAVLILLIGAAVAVTLLNAEPEDEADPVVFKAENIEALYWTYGEEELSFSRSGDGWVYTADKDFPLDSSYLSSMADAVSEIVSYRTLEDVEDPAEYGMDAPDCTVKVTSDGVTRTVLIGKETVVDSMRYVSLGDGDIHMVDESLHAAFCYGLYDLIACEELPVMTEVTAMTVAGETPLELTLVTGEESSDWYAKTAEGDMLLDFDLTQELVSSVTELSWNSCVCYNAAGDLLVQYGLDTAATKVTVSYTLDETAQTFVLELGSALEDGTYVRIADSGMVYLIDSEIANNLRNAVYTDLLPTTEE